MTEVEKMFENANIKPKQEGYCDWDSYCPYPDIINSGCGNECPYWKYKDEANYPPFTAEKQLKIIEWFISYRWWLNLKSLDKKLDFSLCFDEKLAKLVNRLWKSFDDQEKEEIRRILND